MCAGWIIVSIPIPKPPTLATAKAGQQTWARWSKSVFPSPTHPASHRLRRTSYTHHQRGSYSIESWYPQESLRLPVSATCDLQASVRACEPTGVSETETGSSETPRKRKREASRAFKAKKKEREIWSLVFFFNHSTTKNTSITEKKKLYRKTKGSNHTHTPFAAGHFSLKKCNATENREQNTQTHADRKQQHRIKMIPNKTNWYTAACSSCGRGSVWEGWGVVEQEKSAKEEEESERERERASGRCVFLVCFVLIVRRGACVCLWSGFFPLLRFVRCVWCDCCPPRKYRCLFYCCCCCCAVKFQFCGVRRIIIDFPPFEPVFSWRGRRRVAAYLGDREKGLIQACRPIRNAHTYCREFAAYLKASERDRAILCAFPDRGKRKIYILTLK